MDKQTPTVGPGFAGSPGGGPARRDDQTPTRRKIIRMNARRFAPAPADTDTVPTLPRIRAATTATSPPEPPQTTSIGVLIVDDHTPFRIGPRQLLEHDGFTIIDADTTQP